MAKLAIKKASTDVTTYVFIQDSSKTTGEGLTGLVYNTTDLVASYVRPLGTRQALTLATLAAADSAHSDGGFKEVDATNMPGVYRLDLPDAVCATGVPSVVVMLKGATNMSPVVLEIQLTDFDLNTAAITVDGIADAVWDEATADHTTASSFGALDANVDAILADTGTDGVKIANSQPAITWGQQKIIANVSDEGALDIRNSNEDGIGLLSSGYTAQFNKGGAVGVVNEGVTDVIGCDPAIATSGEYTSALAAIQADLDDPNQYKADVSGLALEATLTAIKGAGWMDETLVKIVTDIAAIQAGSGATPQQIWEYATRVLTAGTNIDLSALATATDLATVDTVVDAIKAKTDNLPASPAAVGSAMTLTAAYDKSKDDVLTPLAAVDSIVDGLKTTLDNIHDTDLPAVKTETAAIKAKTDNLPATPASAGEYTAAIAAIPTAPLLAANYTAPDNASIAAILEDTGTTIPATLAGLATSAEVGAITILDEIVVGSYTMQDILKILAAKMVGKATGGGTATITYRGVDDTSNVIVETVDTNGNRSAVTLTV